jgi:putative transposase
LKPRQCYVFQQAQSKIMRKQRREVTTMARRKRHSTAEIEPKLEKADALAASGQTQTEIAKALGISVMTLHRWRKARRPSRPSYAESIPSDIGLVHGPTGRRDPRITELEMENSQLRRLVTNLLLERMRLEEVTHAENRRQTRTRDRDDRGKLVANR